MQHPPPTQYVPPQATYPPQQPPNQPAVFQAPPPDYSAGNCELIAIEDVLDAFDELVNFMPQQII